MNDAGDEWAEFWRRIEQIEAEHDAGMVDGRRPSADKLLRAQEEAAAARDAERMRRVREEIAARVGAPTAPPLLRREPPPGRRLHPDKAATLAGWCEVLRRSVGLAAYLPLWAPVWVWTDADIENAAERAARWGEKTVKKRRRPFEKRNVPDVKWNAEDFAAAAERAARWGKKNPAARKAPAWAFLAHEAFTSHSQGIEGTTPAERGSFGRIVREATKRHGLERHDVWMPRWMHNPPGASGVEGAFNVAWEMLLDFTGGRPDRTKRGRTILDKYKLPGRTSSSDEGDTYNRKKVAYEGEGMACLAEQLRRTWRALYAEKGVWPDLASLNAPPPVAPLPTDWRECAAMGCAPEDLPRGCAIGLTWREDDGADGGPAGR